LLKMIADYMEQGFLSNIVSMFKENPALYELTGALLQDERFRVRIGTTALLEELQALYPEEARAALPSLLPLLTSPHPTVRGDAAYLIGLVGTREDRTALKPLLKDAHPQVRQIVGEILHEG